MPPEPSCLFRVLIYTICSRIVSVLLWLVVKNTHTISGLFYILLRTLFQKQSPGVLLQKLKNSLKSYQFFIGMWRICSSVFIFNFEHVITRWACPKIASLHMFWWKGHGELSTLLNLNVCKILIGKNLRQGFFLNKVAGWNPATIFKWDSSTVNFLLSILLSFTEHLFAEHLRKTASVVYSHVSHFTMLQKQWRTAIQ